MKNFGASSKNLTSNELFFNEENFFNLNKENTLILHNYKLIDDKKYILLALNILESFRIRIHYTYDKLSSLSNSRTRLLPHQIEATHKVINALKPRFLLADEVGLGKTIEAGLIMKELILRKNYENILIVVPAPLQIQWQQELKNKFNEEFIILNYKNFYNTLKTSNKIITSIDFIKNPKYYETLLEKSWQMVIFDEAHRLRRDYHKITQAYHFAEKISKKVEALLLLSATPFRGKIEELYFLIKLLDPHLLGPEHAFFQEYVLPSRNGESIKKLRNKIKDIIIRRRKIEVGGFTIRIARTIKFDLSPEERLFYDETTEYVKKEYNLSKQQQNRAIGFIMIVFQKLLDSSTRALLKALEKRKFMLESKIYNSEYTLGECQYDIDEIIEYSEKEEEIIENIAQMENLNFRSIQDIRKEILTLSKLLSLGKKIKIDTKALKLKETIENLKKSGHNKIIIFTQFRTTQDYLLEILSEYKCNIFHGSLNSEQKEKEILEFKEKGEILICTEAGGEGRNLQFSDVLINYDLPWSPLKMEQRIGRIHRFGQKNDVLILNFSTRDTVAERVLYILENKIRIFEESIGPSDMLLGSIEDEVNLNQFIMDFVSGKITKKEFEETITNKLEVVKKSYQLLSDLVSPSVLDFNLNDYYQITQQERIIDNLHIEKLTLNYLKDNKDSKYSLKKINTIKKNSLKNNVCIYELLPDKQYAVFDSNLALENENYTFLAVGHPLVNEALQFYIYHPEKNCIIKFKNNLSIKKGIFFIFILHYKFFKHQEKKEFIYIYLPSLFSKKYELVQNMDLENLFLKNKNFIKDIEILPISNAELETLKKTSIDIYHWLRKEIKLENSKWYQNIKELYKQEQYKLEISYGKKIRNLEEKKDIEKLRYKMNPTSNRKALVTKVENAIIHTKQELEKEIQELHFNASSNIDIELFQIYWSL